MLVIIARRHPNRLRKLNSFVWIGIYSLVPAIALGRQILLSTGPSMLTTMVPTWLSGGIAAFTVMAILPVRTWIRRRILERTAQGARQFLDSLPVRMMEIEAEISRGAISFVDGNRRKRLIQREMDRVAAVDGVGRFLYLLFKIHLFRQGLQVLGVVAIDAWSEAGVGWHTLDTGSTMVIIEGACILGPYLLLMATPIVLLRGSAPQLQGC
ncbi:MAG: hypothetical protein PF508_09625 [Spirochaeta sp.]|nr:hypothetical protein [Spirochaeta sp.]